MTLDFIPRGTGESVFHLERNEAVLSGPLLALQVAAKQYSGPLTAQPTVPRSRSAQSPLLGWQSWRRSSMDVSLSSTPDYNWVQANGRARRQPTPKGWSCPGERRPLCLHRNLPNTTGTERSAPGLTPQCAHLGLQLDPFSLRPKRFLPRTSRAARVTTLARCHSYGAGLRTPYLRTVQEDVSTGGV